MKSVNEIKKTIKESTTFDGRISPDYAVSFQLKRDIDTLLNLASQQESNMEQCKST